MTQATRTTETPKVKIEITLTRDVSDKIGFADGYNVDLGREVYESYDVRITSKANGQSMTTHGKPGQWAFFTPDQKNVGRYKIGNASVDQMIYNAAMGMMAELDAEISKTAEQVSIETAETTRAATIETAKPEPQHGVNGYCRKCHSYCYGDCGSN